MCPGVVRGGGSRSLLAKGTLTAPFSAGVCLLPPATDGICLLRTLLGPCGLFAYLESYSREKSCQTRPGTARELLHQELHLVLGAAHLLRSGRHQGPFCIGQTLHEFHPDVPGSGWNYQQQPEKLSHDVPQHKEPSFPPPQWLDCPVVLI